MVHVTDEEPQLLVAFSDEIFVGREIEGLVGSRKI